MELHTPALHMEDGLKVKQDWYFQMSLLHSPDTLHSVKKFSENTYCTRTCVCHMVIFGFYAVFNSQTENHCNELYSDFQILMEHLHYWHRNTIETFPMNGAVEKKKPDRIESKPNIS